MNKLLQEIMETLFTMNKSLEKKALSHNEEIEERKNYEDLLSTQKKLKQLLPKLQQNYPYNEKEFLKNIIELHILMDNLRWYFDNAHENIKKIIRNYSPASNERYDGKS